MSINLKNLNQFLICKLCNGYLINATTITECFHTYCQSCLIKFFEKNTFCPTCKISVNIKNINSNLKNDQTLQSIIYKIVPGLFSKEKERRIEFYKNHPEDEKNNELLDLQKEKFFCNSNDLIDVSIEYLPNSSPDQKSNDLFNNSFNSNLIVTKSKKRYLRCEAGMKISHLKKWFRYKFDLSYDLKVEVLYKQEVLKDFYKMVDLAYIHCNKLDRVLNLYYRIVIDNKNIKRKLKFSSEKKKTKKLNNNHQYIINSQNNINISSKKILDCLPMKRKHEIYINEIDKKDNKTQKFNNSFEKINLISINDKQSKINDQKFSNLIFNNKISSNQILIEEKEAKK